MNGRKPYEGIITESEMMTLIENIDSTKDVEWSEYEIDGEKLSYPMWKAVVSSEGDTYEDFLNYFKEAKKKVNSKDLVVVDDEMVGVVEPEDDFETQTKVDVFTESASNGLIFSGEDMVTKIKRLMGNNHVVSDNTGVVKPSSEGMPTKSTKQVTDVDSTKGNKPEFDIAKKAPTVGVGVIKPTDAFHQQTKVDVTSGSGLTKGPNQVSDQTGIVKAKSEGFSSSAKPEIKIDATTGTVEVKKAASNVKPSVGMIKPKDDINPKHDQSHLLIF